MSRHVSEDKYQEFSRRIEVAENEARGEKLGIWSDAMKEERESEGYPLGTPSEPSRLAGSDPIRARCLRMDRRPAVPGHADSENTRHVKSPWGGDAA
jgi:hypothetical protein